MEFNLNADGIDVMLRINGYKKSTGVLLDSEWCDCSFSFVSGYWLNYHKETESVLLAFEVELLEEKLTRLLNDEIADVETIANIEPDFVFIIHPKQVSKSEFGHNYLPYDYPDEDIFVEWRVYFWTEHITDNFFSVTLFRDDIAKLRDYLAFVIKKHKA